MLDDFDMDFPEEEDELEEEDSSSTSNRTFMMVAGGLGALVIIALVCVAVYVFLIKPGRDATTQSTQTAGAAIELAQAETQTQAAYVPPSNTPPPTSTQVPPTSTPPPTATQVPVEDGSGGGPTPDPRTATVQALLTQAALAQTQAAQQLLTQTSTPTATGLPDTGIADDLGNISPQVMLGMAGLLILVIFIARRLRASTG